MPPPQPSDRPAIERAVLDTVRDLLLELGSAEAAARVSPAASLDRDLGLGSLERVELLVRLESTLARPLPGSLTQTADTPAAWARAALESVEGQRTGMRWPILQPAREARAAPRSSTTFAEVLREQAESDPARVHIHLLEGDRGQDISQGQLYARAGEIAAGLAASGLQAGETVAIMLPTCADFFYSFLGVALAGGIAVPIYPPARASQLEEYLRRQSLILRNAGVRFLISFPQVRAVANILGGSLPSLREALGVADLAARGRGLRPPATAAADTFFIQYTSGSTGDPKGVVLTHANVLANVRGIGAGVRAVPTDVVVSWLPLYHDMGLIGSWLFSLYHGFPITILSPLDFLVRPERWLWALSDSGGTLCPAPNFAFELCVRKIRDEALADVDLSRWRVAINAGEPVLPATLDRFAERFRPWGFDPRAFLPLYGLAESSVALTCLPPCRGPRVDSVQRSAFEQQGRAVPTNGSAPRDTLRFVSNGKAMPGHEVRVVGANGANVPERVRGRILFRGPSRTDGYFRNPAATREVLDPDGWLDSGDLGYIAEGELYVTGRLKDCIIKGGRNIIPQDVEMAAWEVAGVRKGCVAAFGTIEPASGTERLVVVAETRVAEPGDRRRIQAEVIEAVASQVGIPPDDVALARPGTVPKTSSGKIQRSATRQLYEADQIRGQAPTAPWVQMARIGLRSTLLASAERAALLARSAAANARAGLGDGVAASFGLAARLAPTPGAAWRIVAPGARLLTALAGVPTHGGLEDNGNRGRVLLANRACPIDPLVLASSARAPFVFADDTGFRGLSAAQAFLLEPLVARPAANGRGPADGTLLDRLELALAEGHTVVALADNPPGEPPARTRFRAEAFLAARAADVPVVPVLLGRDAEGPMPTEPLPVPAADGALAACRNAVRDRLARAAAATVE